jgi:hypothetical protein
LYARGPACVCALVTAMVQETISSWFFTRSFALCAIHFQRKHLVDSS